MNEELDITLFINWMQYLEIEFWDFFFEVPGGRPLITRGLKVGGVGKKSLSELKKIQPFQTLSKNNLKILHIFLDTKNFTIERRGIQSFFKIDHAINGQLCNYF